MFSLGPYWFVFGWLVDGVFDLCCVTFVACTTFSHRDVSMYMQQLPRHWARWLPPVWWWTWGKFRWPQKGPNTRYNKTRPRPFSAYRAKKLHAGVCTGCRYLISLSVCMSVYVCNIHRFYWLQGSMEAGEYGLTRGTWFIARRLEVVEVSGLLWISWCVLRATRFRVVFSFFFFPRTHTACCKY